MESPHSLQYATHQFTMPTVKACPKPGDVDVWVPGSQAAAMSCSQAIGACEGDYFKNFAYNTDQPFTSLCRPNEGLGGGCQSLVAPERAQTWEHVLKPQLKEQLARLHGSATGNHAKKNLLPEGSIDGAKATAICSVKNNTLDQCTGLTGPSCFVPPNHNSWMRPNWKNVSQL